jgi:hemolysin III
MSASEAVSRPLSRAERIADAAVHAAGIAFALMAAPVLIVLAALLDGRTEVVAAVAVYVATLVAMFVCSGAYNLCPETKAAARRVLRRLDHAMIYFKIVGTQTPFVVLVGGAGGWALALLWLGALGGAAAKLLAPTLFPKVSILFYIGLGWAGMMMLMPDPGREALSAPTMILLVTGGALYIGGVLFYLWDGLRFSKAIWHGFVLVATCVFYSAVIVEVSLRAMHA